MYVSPPGTGGLRASLPRLPDGFSPQLIDLGRYLFFDPLLSANHRVSCASCHRPDAGFADAGRPGAVSGLDAESGTPQPDTRRVRNAPSLWNVGFLRNLFWDGRDHSLEEAVRSPLFSPAEMANSVERLELDINRQPVYRRMFARAFNLRPGARITSRMVFAALVALETTLISLNSRYDQYAHGDDDALTDAEKRGLNIFRGIALACSQCHTPPLFTNDELEVTGVPNAPGLPFDPGAGATSALRAFTGAFRTPTLRNIERTAPYMHAGQFATLEEAVRFYNDRPGHAAPSDEHLRIDWRLSLRGPTLSERDVRDVVGFLKALTDESMMPAIPQSVPSGLPVVVNTVKRP